MNKIRKNNNVTFSWIHFVFSFVGILLSFIALTFVVPSLVYLSNITDGTKFVELDTMLVIFTIMFSVIIWFVWLFNLFWVFYAKEKYR